MINATVLYKLLYPSLTWRMPAAGKVIYLTFDDGPVPSVTGFVLDTLKKWNAKATFFCVGANVKRHPEVFGRILSEGHSAGNHTMNHVNGWVTDDEKYFTEVAECSEVVGSKLFRPPYGKIRWSQIRVLKKDYRIIMWDTLSKDYDPRISGGQCFRRVIKNARSGSVIVFHDSLKAEERIRYALPATLDYFSRLGYGFAAIA